MVLHCQTVARVETGFLFILGMPLPFESRAMFNGLKTSIRRAFVLVLLGNFIIDEQATYWATLKFPSNSKFMNQLYIAQGLKSFLCPWAFSWFFKVSTLRLA